MFVNLFDGTHDFEKWHVNWEKIYDVDPEARFFLSWIWLSMWLSSRRRPWFFLAAKPRRDSADYVAFFPLKTRTGTDKDGWRFTEFAMAGNRVSDYTGFICNPEYQDEAIPALATAVQCLSWNSLHLENICASNQRMVLFLKNVHKNDYEAEIKSVCDPARFCDL